MKTKNLLSRFSAAAMIMAASLLPAALTSCSSEAEPNIPDPDPVPEGMARVNLGISYSSLESTTRVDPLKVDATSDEAKISSLYLYIFSCESNGSGDAFVDRINCTSTDGLFTSGNDILGGDYHQIYSHALNAGYYKFYVVANIDAYLTETNGKTILDKTIDDTNTFSLSDLTDEQLSFNTPSTGNQGDKLRSKNGVALPMAGANTDVAKVTKDGTDVTENAYSNGVVHIETGAYTISIDMTFLCAAVRYTFLYDGEKDDNNESAWMYDYFDVSSLGLTNVNTGYTIFATEGALASPQATSESIIDTGRKFKFTGDTGTIYGDPGLLTKTTGGVGERVESWGDDDKKRAFQGIVYLPMNTSTDNMTTLTLGFKIKSNGTEKTKAIALPNLSEDNVLHRGAFYDVVGTLTTSGMEFYVTVKPWVDGGRTVFPI